MRRCFIPLWYMTKKLAGPSLHFLMPKPGSSSSNACTSLLPVGTCNLSAFYLRNVSGTQLAHPLANPCKNKQCAMHRNTPYACADSCALVLSAS